MKILQICHKPPYPPVDGGCMAMNNISQGFLSLGHELKVLCIETDKHPFKKDDIPTEILEKTKMEAIHVDTRVNLVEAFCSVVTSDSYNISRFFTPDVDIRLTEILSKEKFDIIHLESLFVTPYIGTIRRLSKARVYLRSHNLEYMIWERMASGAKNKAKKAYLKLLSKQLKRYEIKTVNDVDGIVAITQEDAYKYQKLNSNTPIITIPFGLDISEYKPIYKSIDKPNLFHIGSMDWKPNIEAFDWFISNVWPKINIKFPHLKMKLAGRNMPDNYNNKLAINVEIVGEVDSAIDFINKNDVMIVPLQSAGGMRIKIIEGMAMGKTIISSSIGAEGINYENGKNILIANTIAEYLKHIDTLIQNPEKCNEIGKNARTLIEEQYDSLAVTKNLIEFYNSNK